MGSLSIWHWLIVLVIVALVFGTKKLGNIGHDLGSAVRGFKKAMNDGDQEEQALRKQLPPAGLPVHLRLAPPGTPNFTMPPRQVLARTIGAPEARAADS